MPYSIDEFIREALGKGLAKADIKTALIAADWKEEEVEAGLAAFADVTFPIPVPRRKPYLSAREAFLYLLLFLCLYLSAWSFGSLIFRYVGRYIPDLLKQYESVSLTDLRLYVSMLMVAFPIYLWMTSITSKEMRLDPDKRGSKIRKWLTYITLFVAAGVIIGDLITLFFNLLEGELTVRFILKVVTVLYIAGLIFGYYLWELRGEERQNGDIPPAVAGGVSSSGGSTITLTRKIFLGIALASVIASLVSGFFIGGSPAAERERKLDEQRISALQQISSTLEAYYHEKTALPASLDELTKNSNYYLPSLLDPKTGAPYEYRPTGANSYDLCAVFETESLPYDQNQPQYSRPYPYGGVMSWDHGIGLKCYQVTVKIEPAALLAPTLK